MRASRWILCVVVVGLAIALVGSAQSPTPQGVFHTGATAGIIRDATKVGSTIYAVGTWLNSATVKIDGALWTFDGANAPTRSVWPDFAASPANLNTDAVTPNAESIASQVRASAGATAVRVTRDPATNALTVLDLTPTSAFPPSDYATGGRVARAVSNDGSVLYGQVNKWLGLLNNPTNPNSKIFQGRVMRFDVSGTTVTATEIYPQAATIGGYTAVQTIQPRAISSDGSVALFSTATTAAVVDQQAFRYVHGAGSTAVPLLPGGMWNAPIALTDDGKIVLAVSGDNSDPALTNRELYLADYSTGSESLTRLGSPNERWGFNGGGLTADGSVVAITSSGCVNPIVCRYGYFHNGNGWFQLPTAMAAAGMDLTGWQQFQIQGISADGTLVWGSGFHNGAEEGYVAEFATGFLKNFDVVAAPPTNMSIVGAWATDGTGNPNPDAPTSVAVFMADGTYYQIESDGFERGSYAFDGISVKPTTRLDTNGDGGLSGDNGSRVSVSVFGDELRSPANCTYDLNNPDACFVAHRIMSPAGQAVSGWVLGNPAQADSSAVIVLTASGKYFMAQDGNPAVDPGGRDGIEIGTLQWDPATGAITVLQIAADTNGEWGLSHPIGTNTATLSADSLQLIAGDDSGTNTLTRIVDPNTVKPVITSSLAETGEQDTPYTYTVTTAWPALAIGATGLPTGLTINPTTGVISGTPTQVGTFQIGLSASNTLGAANATLELVLLRNSNVRTITRTGFYEPVSQIAGFVNTVKGGSTVPLKFNVAIDGVEKTDTAGLAFGVWSVGCSSSTAEDPVDFTTTGGTSLRYDTTALQFIQNWKTPTAPGCYLVRMTTTEDGGSLSALFKVK